MQAIVHRRYGGPEVLALAEVDLPTIAEDEVLVRVHASSVNPYDWRFMRGDPALLRAVAGLRRPRQPILGADVAGRVEAVGGTVTRFRVGDEVYGLLPSRGCFAEHVAVPERMLAGKPANLTFAQAAAVPLGALTALQSLRDHRRIEPGAAVLVNGSSGGVGTFAVQIAKAFGARVTGVCSTRNVDMVRGLGADHVVDYTRQDFVSGASHYDLLVDNVGNRRLRDLRRVLQPDGMLMLVTVLQPMTFWTGVPRSSMKVAVAKRAWSQQVVSLPMVRPRTADLDLLTGLIESGEVTPVIDRTWPLRDTADAIAYVEAGHARGKVVITV
ncbi:MAG TPA: NAD(P)-dependent alcohol dehydrogenase [Euzebyales bacterium]|nr:NAD(P)-dependent alcohol dehydrogenase [Euzebyales bacterium]